MALVEFTNSLSENIKIIKDVFSNDDTLTLKTYQNKYLSSGKCCVFYICGLVNLELINENIIRPFLLTDLSENISSENLINELQRKVLLSADILGTTNINQAIDSVLNGDTALLLDGFNKALIINTKQWPTRAVAEPKAELVIKGPREGFVESIQINTSLIRRKLVTTDLKFVYKNVGDRTNTKVCICYIEGVANDNIINEIYKRLDKISIDGILDASYIQEMIKDSPYSIFETIGYSERPDSVAGKLLEGRIGIIVDGSPIVLTAPFIFIEYFQISEDYYNNFFFASMSRILRIMGLILSISTPAIYVSLVTYHQEMIPTPLLISIAASRKGVPLPTIIEAFLMFIVFEIFIETSKRMHESMGMAISLVGALVLGQAAVDARIVSSPMVIVVGLTGIASLTLPKLKGPNVIIRFIFMLLVSFLGLYGYMFGMIGLLLYLMSLRSFGVPYMANITSLKPQQSKDTVVRAPWWYMKLRPKAIAIDYIRKKGTKPQVKDNENN